MSRKVFTAGEVLAAADVNSFLMDQTVMSFASSAARGSAIPTPTLGMYTHLEDTPARTQFWNGSAWVSPCGSTLVATNAFTSATTLDVDNVFSSEFDVYEIVISLLNSTAVDAAMQLRVSGTTAATNYAHTQLQAQGTSATVSNLTSQSSFPIGRLDGNVSFVKITLSNPFLVDDTIGFTQSFDSAGFTRINGVRHLTLASYTGFRLTMSASTGTLRVYGLRK
jgi:hypothetical protein